MWTRARDQITINKVINWVMLLFNIFFSEWMFPFFSSLSVHFHSGSVRRSPQLTNEVPGLIGFLSSLVLTFRIKRTKLLGWEQHFCPCVAYPRWQLPVVSFPSTHPHCNQWYHRWWMVHNCTWTVAALLLAPTHSALHFLVNMYSCFVAPFGIVWNVMATAVGLRVSWARLPDVHVCMTYASRKMCWKKIDIHRLGRI